MPERRERYNYKDEFRHYTDRRLQEIVRQAQEVLDERDLVRNNLSVERFMQLHTPDRGCQVQELKGSRRSGFVDSDGFEHLVEVISYSCQTHGTSSEKRLGKIFG